MAREAILRGEAELAARDPAIAGLVRRAGPCTLGGRRHRTHFEALVRSVVFQQLAGKAATAIHGRLLALFDGDGLAPEALLVQPEERLRGAGLSAAKVASLRDLAGKALDGTVPLQGLGRLTDGEVVARLSTVRGIGRWTAEMFLMFQLGRPDVWPVGDLGVRTGYAIAYELPTAPSERQLGPLGEPFRPYRSVAAWYCWQAVHLARGEVTPR